MGVYSGPKGASIPGGAEESSRIIGWVSGGAASAVTCKLAIAKYGLERVELIYIDPGSEHEDTRRFLSDLEAWLGKPVARIRSAAFFDTWAVWEKRRFLRGQRGAPCTGALKSDVRGDLGLPPDTVQLWGFTAEESKRAETFQNHHYGEMVCEFPLIDQNVSKADCYALIERAGMKLPEPYLQGFDNNNCLPCVKAEGAAYWNRIRRFYPDRFDRMAKLERELGYALVRKTINGAKVSVFLDELDPDDGRDDDTPEPISCGITCFIAEQNMKDAA